MSQRSFFVLAITHYKCNQLTYIKKQYSKQQSLDVWVTLPCQATGDQSPAYLSLVVVSRVPSLTEKLKIRDCPTVVAKTGDKSVR